MNSEELLIRIEKLDDRIKSFNTSLTAINNKIAELDDRTSGFLNLLREEKKEVANLNSTVMGLGQFDSAIAQFRSDFNHKLEDLEKQRKQEEQIRTNLIKEDIKSNKLLVEAIRAGLTKEFDDKLTLYKKENVKLISQLREIEIEARESLQSFRVAENGMSLITQDVKRTLKQVENLQAEVGASIDKQNEMRSKIELISKNIRNDKIRLDEVIATESELKKVQLDFIDKQSILQKDRDRIWVEWEHQYEELSKQIYGLLPELQNQQFNLKQSQNNFDEINSKFERRINELTEMYRLMDEKLRKEWVTFKADSEKRWSNISMVVEDKQGGYANQFQSMMDRIIMVEDNTHEMQEMLLLLSTEAQKGMQNLMKMVNGWMDAFGKNKSSK
jgi:chromosome segregation ATPase